MSAKYFCDVCEAEMICADHGRLSRKLGDVKIEIVTGYKDGTNNGHICHACVLKAVNEGVPTKPMLR